MFGSLLALYSEHVKCVGLGDESYIYYKYKIQVAIYSFHMH